MRKFEELNLSFSEIVESMSKKEKKLYEKDISSDEVVTYKIILDFDCSPDVLERELPDLLLVTKEKEVYNWYFAEIKEEELEDLINQIEYLSMSEENDEEAKILEEEARLAEEERLQQLKEENELEYEIKMIYASKQVIRDIKEVCEDIGQLIYRLKNQVNFMSFYYLIEKNMNVDYKNYSRVFNWYMDLSEKYVRYKKIDIEYTDNSREYFESQLKTITNTYNILNSTFKIFQAEIKFSEQNFDSIRGKLPKDLILKLLAENIFGFRKELEE